MHRRPATKRPVPCLHGYASLLLIVIFQPSVVAQSPESTPKTITNAIGMQLTVVSPGEFLMGSPANEAHRSDDEVQHRVCITSPFLMGTYEVMQEQFQRVMGKNPSGFQGDPRLPVENVSWEDAVRFCEKLSQLEDEKRAGRAYRLPTEAEWEYACRAGTTTAFAHDNTLTSAQANFDGSSPYGLEDQGPYLGRTRPVGSYQPNAFGLYDMHGNVWEWCSDWYAEGYYMNCPSEDPLGPATGTAHVIRGGSWYNFGHCLRSAYRYQFTPPLEDNFYGFRVVCTVRAMPDQIAASEPKGVASWSGSTAELLAVFSPIFERGALLWLALFVLLLNDSLLILQRGRRSIRLATHRQTDSGVSRCWSSMAERIRPSGPFSLETTPCSCSCFRLP